MRHLKKIAEQESSRDSDAEPLTYSGLCRYDNQHNMLKGAVVKPHILITETKYGGKYVAMKSFVDNTVVASGVNAAKVHERAQKKGVADPVMLFVPKQNVSYIY